MSKQGSTTAAPIDGSLWQWKPWYLDAILVVSVFVVTLAGLIFGEKIQVNQGLGWDGRTYAWVAQNFDTLITEGSLNNYNVQRILPSALIHYGMQMFSVPFTPPNMVMVFGLLDVALLTAGAALWCRIANQVHLSPQAKVIGFIGLFVNFAVLKFATYYTILTDTAALALGIATLYCWLTNWRVGLYLVIVAGAFTWPTVAYQAALLLLFPSPGDLQSTAPAAGVDRVLAFLRQNQRFMAIARRVWSWLQPPNLWLALVAALAVGVACIRFWRMDPNGGPMNGWYTPIQHLMPLSVLFAAGFIFLGLLILWDSRRVFTAAYWLHAFRWRDLFGVGGLLVGIAILQSRLAPQHMATDFVLEFTITGAIKAPAEFLVAHLMYVGPIIAVIILYWKRTSDLIRNYGGGLLLVTSLVLFMSLRSETRTLLNFLPVFVLVAAQALDSQGEWSVTRIALFAALSVLLSSVWLPINSRFETYYFMHQGPYMARWTYYVFLAIAILTMACVYALFKPRSNAVVDATRNEGA